VTTPPPSKPASPVNPAAAPNSEAFVESILREVDTSLGIESNDSSFDLSSAQFWYRAAFQKDLESLFNEKARMKILIDGLKTRRFSEEDIHTLFARIRKARMEKRLEEQESAAAATKVRLKLATIIGGILVVFGLLIFFSLKRQHAQEQADAALAKARTLRWESGKNVSRRRGVTDSEFSVIPLRKLEMYEGDLIQTTAGENTIPFPEGAFLTVQPNSRFRISQIDVTPPDLRLTLVRLELEEGGFSWKKPETSSIHWQFAFPGGEIKPKWGLGSVRVDGTRRRVAIIEGENSLSRPGKLNVPLNGSMEAIFDGDAPEVIQLME